MKKRKNVPKKRGRKKGVPGTVIQYKIILRRNKLKQMFLETQDVEKLAYRLNVSQRTVWKDLEAIRNEVIEKLKKISKEDVFVDFLQDLRRDDAILEDTISKAMKDIKARDGDSTRAALYNAVVRAVAVRGINRAKRMYIGQTLGIYPMIRPGIDIKVTYEMKLEVVMSYIETVIYPIMMKNVKTKEDQRRVAEEIDQGTHQFLEESGIEEPGQRDKQHKE